MDQGYKAPVVGQLLRQVARLELRTDGYPVAVDHLFSVHTGDDTCPIYPVRITVETALADGSGQPVLSALAHAALQLLTSALSSSMALEEPFRP